MNELPADVLWIIFRQVLASEIWTSCLQGGCIHKADCCQSAKSHYKNALKIRHPVGEFLPNAPYVTRQLVKTSLAGGYFRCPQMFLQRLRLVCRQWKHVVERFTTRANNGVIWVNDGISIAGLATDTFRLVFSHDVVHCMYRRSLTATYWFN